MARFPKRPPHTAASGMPEDPYGHATQIQANFVEQAERHARHWQWGMFGASALALAMGLCLTYQSVQPTVRPYVIEVDATGAVRNVGPAEVAYVPTDAAIARQVREFLVATRGLSTDPVVVHQQWDWAFAICTQRGTQQLAAYGESRQLNKIQGKKAIAVKITRTLRASPTTLDVTWEETTIDAEGHQESQRLWSGLFTIVLRQPTTDTELQQNPLGIWLDSWAWSAL